MKIFANKEIWKKIVIVFMLIFSVSFVEPKPVEAVGGTLTEPICNFLVGLGDGAVNLLHRFIVRQDTTLIRVSESDSWNWVQIAIAVAAITVIGITLISGVGALAAAGVSLAAIKIAGLMVVQSVATGLFAAVMISSAEAFTDEIPLPLYSLTPDTILSGKIPLFDVNFVNPTDDVVHYDNSKGAWTQTKTQTYADGIADNSDNFIQEQTGMDKQSFIGSAENQKESRTHGGWEEQSYINGDYKITEKKKEGTTIYTVYKKAEMPDEGNIPAFSKQLQEIVAKWYNNLRMIAIVGMMSVLVYIGIRIVISSAASDKAKYKQMLGDWLIGMILLFTMHYIMNFANLAVNSLTDVLSSINKAENVQLIPDKVGNKEGLIEQVLEEQQIPSTNDNGDTLYIYHGKDENVKEDGLAYIEWHTNLMGVARIKADEFKNANDDSYIGYTLIFIVLVIYTIMFCWTYLRRVIYMAFLTLISPLVALTYPIDKVNDGKAQGFDYWFKEYIFNLLLQPMHLLIYTILVSSSIELAQKNWVYSLVAIGFVLTAEKIVRTMFNFQKASTPGVFAGPAGAALTISGMRWLFGHGPKGEKNDDKSNGSSSGGSNVKSYGKVNGMPSGLAGFSFASNEGDDDDGNGSGIRHRIGNGDASGDTTGSGSSTGSVSGSTTGSSSSTGSVSGSATRSSSSTGGGNKGKRGIRRGLANATGKYFKNQSERFKRKAEKVKPIRMLGGAALGATAGAIGVAAGIASGDPSKVAQYAGIGLAGGYKLGTGSVDALTGDLSIEGVGTEFQRGYLGDEEYKRRKDEKEAIERAHEEATIEAVRKYDSNLSYLEAMQKAEELSLDYGNKYDINNPEDWINIEKFIDSHTFLDEHGDIKRLNREQGAKLHELNNRYGIGSKNGSDLEKIYAQMAKDENIDNDSAIRVVDLAKAYANSLRKS